MENMRTQAEKFDAEMIDDDIVSVDLTGDIKLLTDSAGTVHRAKKVIIATGSGYRKLGLPNEDELSGRGVSWCATCDGFFFRDRDIAVVGGGDTAMEEATFLTRFARSVTVVHRRSTPRASKVMQDRAFADDKISFAFDSEITEITEIKETNGMLGGVVLRNVFTGATRDLDVTGLFIAIGHDPRTELFAGQIELDSEGYIKVAAPTTRTSLPGVFAAGDVVDHTYRQAITAALNAERYLATRGAAAIEPETAAIPV
jgi:thioredoxin reductase (NADPH)